ncbi:HEPN/Toprim-associated domain-containing protein [Nocardioides sp. NPDC057772]|uniref:HEPN/Toprim-associated domain-containing protein n=1 Tax=Nocardioides sp. NPDC057772 TaxID=3346245 RepID=UPI00366F56EC
MGTEIMLSLNDINIDYGKNRYWKGHYWLFPPGSEANVPTEYVSGFRLQPGYEASLADVRFRLCHLGYSAAESRAKFETYLNRWQRTDDDLKITYDEFHDTITGIEFARLTSDDLKPYIWDFRDFVIARLASSDDEIYGLEDFIYGLDFAITLRALCDRPDNLQLPLRWQTQDLIDSGWVALEDLKDIDRLTYINNHTLLFGRIQDHVGLDRVNAFDKWLHAQGLPRATPYLRLSSGGVPTQETLTLPVAVRHKIHHPENTHNVLTDDELRESTELLLDTVRNLPAPGLGLA